MGRHDIEHTFDCQRDRARVIREAEASRQRGGSIHVAYDPHARKRQRERSIPDVEAEEVLRFYQVVWTVTLSDFKRQLVK